MFSLSSLVGQELVLDSLNDNEQIDVSYLAKGVYSLKLEGGMVLQFVKE